MGTHMYSCYTLNHFIMNLVIKRLAFLLSFGWCKIWILTVKSVKRLELQNLNRLCNQLIKALCQGFLSFWKWVNSQFIVRCDPNIGISFERLFFNYTDIIQLSNTVLMACVMRNDNIALISCICSPDSGFMLVFQSSPNILFWWYVLLY